MKIVFEMPGRLTCLLFVLKAGFSFKKKTTNRRAKMCVADQKTMI